jgi:hypothetical protein
VQESLGRLAPRAGYARHYDHTQTGLFPGILEINILDWHFLLLLSNLWVEIPEAGTGTAFSVCAESTGLVEFYPESLRLKLIAPALV